MPDYSDDAKDAIKKSVSYDPDTGKFTWLYREGCTARWNNRFAGKDAGQSAKGKYLAMKFNYRIYYLHRVAWMLMTGEWPENEVDHINGDKSDNRFCNLRSATRAQNARNKAVTSASKTGVTGVCFRPLKGKWDANITVMNKQVHLGRFATMEAAIEARKDAELHYYGCFSRQH
jgi:hypothetical protein